MRWPTILVIAPHLDDECWSGALLAREQGAARHVLYLTSGPYRGQCGVPLDPYTIRIENAASLRVLGLHTHHLHMAPYDLDAARVRQGIWEMVRDLKPDLVLCSCSVDCHQDHEVAHEETVRVLYRMDCDVLGYMVPGNGQPQTTHQADVTTEHLAQKQAMIDCYITQQWRGRVSAGAEERYEVIKWRI